MKLRLAAMILTVFSGAALSAKPLPQPSLDKPCLSVSGEGVKTFHPSEVDRADFCAPEGASIQSVTMSEAGVWAISQPWRTDVPGPHLPNRLAFSQMNAHPGGVSLFIETTKGVYQIDIVAEKSPVPAMAE